MVMMSIINTFQIQKIDVESRMILQLHHLYHILSKKPNEVYGGIGKYLPTGAKI